MTDGQTFFSEEKRDTRSETLQVAPGILAYRIWNTAIDGRYRIEKEVLTDPWRDVVLQRVRFVPLQGALADFRVYVLLAPHLANRGSGNTAWVGDYKGAPMLFAERDHHEIVLKETRAMARLASEHEDDGTNDLLVSDVIHTNELQVWFVAEHVVDTPVVRAD